MDYFVKFEYNFNISIKVLKYYSTSFKFQPRKEFEIKFDYFFYLKNRHLKDLQTSAEQLAAVTSYWSLFDPDTKEVKKTCLRRRYSRKRRKMRTKRTISRVLQPQVLRQTCLRLRYLTFSISRVEMILWVISTTD